MIVRIEDVWATGHCVRGARAWFKLRGLDWRDFLKNGIASEVLLATGDALAERVVDRARNHADG